ncbi:unnamed protein product, partial [Cladocopium goreaui]
MDDKRLGAAPSLNEFEVLEGGKWRAPPVGHAFSRLVLNFNADSDDAAAAAASGSLNLAGDSGVDSNSEESEKEKKVKWPYLSDEEIFASFSTKRKIVDCRDEYDKTVADSIALEKYLVKVNPVEAMLDENYFWRKLLATQGDQVDVGASLFSVQKQLADAEEEKGALMKQNNRY